MSIIVTTLTADSVSDGVSVSSRVTVAVFAVDSTSDGIVYQME